MTEDEQKFYDACAMAALNWALTVSGEKTGHAALAWGCFSIADAMLTERRKRMGGE